MEAEHLRPFRLLHPAPHVISVNNPSPEPNPESDTLNEPSILFLSDGGQEATVTADLIVGFIDAA